MRQDNPGLEIFEYQVPATLNQAAPVNGTYYTILDEKNVKIYEIAVNVEDADETLGVRITIDGAVIAGSTAATHSTTYNAYRQPNAISMTMGLVLDANGNLYVNRFGELIEGHDVLVEVRKTTALGAGNLTGIVTWGKKINA